jgi:hypothetical protein
VKLHKTVGELLGSASSRELTEWQAYWQYLAEQSEQRDGRRKWNEE